MDLKKLEDRNRLLPADGIGGKKDLLPLYADKEALGALVTYLAEPFRGKVDYVCSPEPLGFIIGSMLARELGVGLIVIRRNSQFLIDPEEQVTASFINHYDKVTTLVTERALLPAGSKVLLADDWMSTAATIQACMNMVEDAGCVVAGIATVGANYKAAARDLVDNGKIRCVYCEKSQE